MQDYQTLMPRLCGIVKPFCDTAIDVREDTDLLLDLGLDSLKVMQILVAVEDSFDVSIPLNILPNVRTIKDFAEQLAHLLSEEA